MCVSSSSPLLQVASSKDEEMLRCSWPSERDSNEGVWPWVLLAENERKWGKIGAVSSVRVGERWS